MLAVTLCQWQVTPRGTFYFLSMQNRVENSSTDVDYQPVGIGDARWLLPTSSVLWVTKTYPGSYNSSTKGHRLLLQFSKHL